MMEFWELSNLPQQITLVANALICLILPFILLNLFAISSAVRRADKILLGRVKMGREYMGLEKRRRDLVEKVRSKRNE